MPEAPLLRGVSSGEPEERRRSSCQWRTGKRHHKGHLGTLLTLFLETYLVSLPPLPWLGRLLLPPCSELPTTLIWPIRIHPPVPETGSRVKDMPGMRQ